MIKQLFNRVRPLVPEDWQVCEGFFLSLTGNSSPEHLSISPRDRRGRYKERKERYTPVAVKIADRLRAEGLRVKLDGWVVYITP